MHAHLSPFLSGTLTAGTQTPSPTKAPAPRDSQTGETVWSDQETPYLEGKHSLGGRGTVGQENL